LREEVFAEESGKDSASTIKNAVGTPRLRSDSPRNGKKIGPFALTNGPEKGEGRIDCSIRPS